MKAGITGHQDLGEPKTVRWVRRILQEACEKYSIEFGFTSLAVGADQLFADILAETEVPFVAIIPSRNYETTFGTPEDLENYRRLLSSATQTEVLNFDQPGEEAFFAAGKQVVQRSDIVLAVWDGRPARGLGGTGDLVEFARATGKKLVHINPVAKTCEELSG